MVPAAAAAATEHWTDCQQYPWNPTTVAPVAATAAAVAAIAAAAAAIAAAAAAAETTAVATTVAVTAASAAHTCTVHNFVDTFVILTNTA